jgi:hypothetical protein
VEAEVVVLVAEVKTVHQRQLVAEVEEIVTCDYPPLSTSSWPYRDLSSPYTTLYLGMEVVVVAMVAVVMMDQSRRT